MLVKVLSVRTLPIVELKRGDLLVDPRLKCGFGEVVAIAPDEQASGRLMVVSDSIAYAFDAGGLAQVAEIVSHEQGFGVRKVDGDSVGFPAPAALYQREMFFCPPTQPVACLAST